MSAPESIFETLIFFEKHIWMSGREAECARLEIVYTG